MEINMFKMQLALFSLFLSTLSLAQPQYETFRIESSNVTNGLRVTGKIVPLDGTLYFESARFTGRVTSVLVKEGDEIHPGKPMLLINSAECLSLYQEKKMAQSRHLDDMSQVIHSREKQLSMRAEANACYIVSSSGGVVTKKMVEAGSNFNVGDNLFTLINRHSLTVELDIPERDALKIKLGQKVVIQRPADPGKVYTSTINAIIPSLNSVSRTVKARLKKIDFANNPSLEEFIFGEIQIQGDGILFKVPSSSVVFVTDGDYIVKSTKGKLTKIPVTVVNQNDDFFFIREKNLHSIQVGDEIVSKGAVFQLQKGQGAN